MTDTELQLREAIIAKCRWMNATGLNQERPATSRHAMATPC